MKALLLLGGSQAQTVAIEKARSLGYRTVLCDYLPDNPGQHLADRFYQVSTTDGPAVLEVARAERADGVLAYASDPASPTAAFVAAELGIPGNPPGSVVDMGSKVEFRRRMEEAGLPCPKSVGFSAESTADEAAASLAGMKWPIVVKPVDSSGSKGVTVVRDREGLASALAAASAHTRCGKLVAEEYIEAAFPHVVGGDVFVVDGEVRFWGLMSCLRDAACPLVPVGKKIPSGLSEVQYRRSKEVLQKLVSSLGIRFGELNVEIIIGEGDVPYVVELGSRAGGNMIPVQLSDASGIDLVRANVMCAMGDDPGDLLWEPDGCCFATYVLHANFDGVYQDLKLSAEAEAACYRRVLYVQPGAAVERFDGANKALGILFFRFDGEQQMDNILERIDQHVRLDIEACS